MTAKGKVYHRWTPEEEEIVRLRYEQTTTSSEHLAVIIGGVSPTAVRRKAAALGVCKVIDRRRWTPEEERKLGILIEHGKAQSEIAKELHRSVDSVRVRANRYLGLRFRDHSWYTKKDICQILGVGHKWVQRRIDAGTLKARPHFKGTVPGKLGLAPWHVEEKDLRQFIIDHPHELTGRNCDITAIVALLTGQEHRWENEAQNLSPGPGALAARR